jgi:hypothetical protein
VLKVALVGAGPRGLGAAEALAQVAAEGLGGVDAGGAARSAAARAVSSPGPGATPEDPSGPVLLTVFDPHPSPGAGPNHDPEQPELDRLNLPLRVLDLPSPRVPGVSPGGLHAWARGTAPDLGEDAFPPRAFLGRYLSARWRALTEASVPGFRLVHRPLRVTGAALRPFGAEDGTGGRPAWWLEVEGEEALQGGRETALHGPFHELLLCPGHQPVSGDPQLLRWREHARQTSSTLAPAYPGAPFLEQAAAWEGRVVAVRGLALSMLDVVRRLTVGMGGTFEEVEGGDGALRYRPSGREPARIVPFSLDGLPPAPKPATARVDASFDPPPREVEDFEAALPGILQGSHGEARQSVRRHLEAMRRGVARRLELEGDPRRSCPSAGEGRPERPASPERWETVQSPEGAVAMLQAHLAMARGRVPPSAAYLDGQLWRKLQPLLRKAFRDHPPPPETAAALVELDEGWKRFSYGPPAEAAAELLALLAAGLLDLRAVADPDVVLDPGGWRLDGGAGEVTAPVMVNAVLPAPELARVSSPLLSGLVAEGWLVPVAQGLGARTAADGQALDAQGQAVPGLSLLGRLALGSVIGADSVLEAFGGATLDWARAVVRRHRED